MINLYNLEIKYIKGVGPKRAELLAKELKLFTAIDLLYFFPYKYLTDKKWDEVLREYIPVFINARTALEYQLAVLQLAGETCDTHARFLLEENDFINSLKGFNGSNITIVGYQHESEINQDVKKHSLSELREKGLSPVIQKVLKEIPQNRKILVHLDIDAISKEELYAVYSPSNTGLSILETTKILREILADSRTAGMELTEFFPPFDGDGSQAKKLINMLVEVFGE